MKIPRGEELSFGAVSNLRERRYEASRGKSLQNVSFDPPRLSNVHWLRLFPPQFPFPCLSSARWRSINILRVVDTDCLEIEDLGRRKMAELRSKASFLFPRFSISNFWASSFYFKTVERYDKDTNCLNKRYVVLNGLIKKYFYLKDEITCVIIYNNSNSSFVIVQLHIGFILSKEMYFSITD